MRITHAVSKVCSDRSAALLNASPTERMTVSSKLAIRCRRRSTRLERRSSPVKRLMCTQLVCRTQYGPSLTRASSPRGYIRQTKGREPCMVHDPLDDRWGQGGERTEGSIAPVVVRW